MIKHSVVLLDNGVRLITVPMPGVETVTVMVAAAVGSRFEARQTSGLSHLLEHMAFKGTKKRPTTAAIATEVDAVGGETNAFTDKEITTYYLKLPTKHIELAFDILADMLLNSLFKEEEIEKEKKVVVEEINMREDSPMIQVEDDFTRLLYGDTPMGWDTAGTKESVMNLKRDDFLHHIRTYYFPTNMGVAVAGNFFPPMVHQLAKSFFGKDSFSLPDRQRSREIEKAKWEQSRPDTRPRVKLHFKKTEQAHFCLGVPGYPFSHPDRYVLAVLTAVLGGGMSSRLFLEIRERRGMAYYVASEKATYTDSGFVLSRAGVKLDKIEEAIKLTLKQMKLLTEKKIGQKELSKTKEYLKGHLLLGLEDSKNVAGEFLASLLLERIRPVGEILRLIDKVTAPDCLRVARDVFRPQRLNLAIIGPYKNKEIFKKLLTS